MADGPVGQSFTPGPVGPCGIVSGCKPNDPIADSPVGSTETPDPVDQTERPIQIDIMKIVTTDEPASLVSTPPPPPSSDSGIHSWGEQWENMSISTAYTEAEQNGSFNRSTLNVIYYPFCTRVIQVQQENNIYIYTFHKLMCTSMTLILYTITLFLLTRLVCSSHILIMVSF